MQNDKRQNDKDKKTNNKTESTDKSKEKRQKRNTLKIYQRTSPNFVIDFQFLTKQNKNDKKSTQKDKQ